MDMYKSFHDIVRLLCVFLEPLINISAWFITRVFILARSSILWFKSRITKQALSRSNWRVESSALKCGQFLGEGFSGFVYEATWSRGRHTAGLLARKAFPAVPADVFEYEAYRLIALDHQNIVETYGWTIDRRSCSLVMDRMKYDLLSVVQKRMEAMRKGGRGATLPIPLREAVNIMYQIAAGVNYVHNNGLVHGDLIPNNVLVDSEAGLAMAVKIVDFGLTETKKWSTAALVSHHARCLQTLKWKAPELFEELLGSSFEDSDEVWTDMFPDKMSNAASSMNNDRAKKLQRADVYSFALTCSYILGAPPMSSKAGPFELRQEISSGAKRPLLPVECPGLLASLISRCWNKEPSRRPDFVDICKDLQYLKWDLRRNEEILQEYYRRSKSQGQRRREPSWTVIVSKGYKSKCNDL